MLPALGLLRGEERKPGDPWTANLGALTIRPFGFLDFIETTRSATTAASVSTPLGGFPLADTPNQSLASPRHSRLMLMSGLPLGAVYDAYLAATAVSLSASIGTDAPRWTRQPERILRQPWFANPGRHMRALLLVESPAAFRERNLFVSANALSVA